MKATTTRHRVDQRPGYSVVRTTGAEREVIERCRRDGRPAIVVIETVGKYADLTIMASTAVNESWAAKPSLRVAVGASVRTNRALARSKHRQKGVWGANGYWTVEKVLTEDAHLLARWWAWSLNREAGWTSLAPLGVQPGAPVIVPYFDDPDAGREPKEVGG